LLPGLSSLEIRLLSPLSASTDFYTIMTVQTVPLLVTLPATAPIEDIITVLRRDGTIVLSGFVSLTMAAIC
jgi:hypothetical protein